MSYDCAVYVDGVSAGEHIEFLEGLVEEDILEEANRISFTDAETIAIVNYAGTEFTVRHGEFVDGSGAKLWILFEFGAGSDDRRICDAGAFERLSEKLPKLQQLRSEIADTFGNETGGGIYRSKKLPFAD